jgi:hypothetical protein
LRPFWLPDQHGPLVGWRLTGWSSCRRKGRESLRVHGSCVRWRCTLHHGLLHLRHHEALGLLETGGRRDHAHVCIRHRVGLMAHNVGEIRRRTSLLCTERPSCLLRLLLVLLLVVALPTSVLVTALIASRIVVAPAS